MNTKQTVERLRKLQTMLVEFGDIARMVHWPGKSSRRETDVEHSYSLAMLVWYLNDELSLKLDKQKLLEYALVHDLVEGYAGDVSLFADQKHHDTKAEKEAISVKQLGDEFGFFADMNRTLHNYEQRADQEAKFVYAVDKIQPAVMTTLGKTDTFQQDKITIADYKAAHQRQTAKITGAFPDIEPLHQELIKMLSDHNFHD